MRGVRCDGSRSERGSALVAVLLLALVTAGMLSTLMGRSLVEQRRANSEHAQDRAFWQARGELELGMRKVARSTYTAGSNDVLRWAIESGDGFVANTNVFAEEIPGTNWYRLTAGARFDGEEGVVRAILRDGLAYVAYNYYVENGDLGISGKPQGRIHTNRKLQMYFPGGVYDEFVSSGTGFEFLNGATAGNTLFLGGADDSADSKTLLQDVDYAQLESMAAFVGGVDQYARVYFSGDQMRVRLYREPYTVEVEETHYNHVYVGDELQETTEDVYIGDALMPYDHPVYRLEWQTVSVRHEELVWVPFSEGGTGTDVYGGGGATGYWDTNVWYEDELQEVSVFDHWEVRHRMEPQYEEVTVEQWVPIYEAVPYTVTDTVTITNEKVHDEWHAADGLFYFPGRIVDVEGKLNGHVTLVTEGYAEIDDHIRYVDDEGDFAYLNGTDPSKPYEPNPDFERDHSLAIVAQESIRYDRYVPSSLEINGSLISTGGLVSYEGIGVDSNGDPYRYHSSRTRTSLRRFGSIMSWFRPVSTFLDDDGQVEHGFMTGSSVFDTSLLMSPPPGTPTEDIPVLWAIHRVAPSRTPSVATEDPPPTFAPVTGLRADSRGAGRAAGHRNGMTWGGGRR